MCRTLILAEGEGVLSCGGPCLDRSKLIIKLEDKDAHQRRLAAPPQLPPAKKQSNTSGSLWLRVLYIAVFSARVALCGRAAWCMGARLWRSKR